MKEVTYEEWQKNPTPRMMWVWNDDIEEREKSKVVYVIKGGSCRYPVRVTMNDDTDYEAYRHCAEIEEPQYLRMTKKYRRMTNQELAWWLQDSIKEGKHRERKFIGSGSSVINSTMCYIEEESNDLVGTDILIRENGGEWHEPLVEVEE